MSNLECLIYIKLSPNHFGQCIYNMNRMAPHYVEENIK